MSQGSNEKPAAATKPQTGGAELSKEELDRVTGGDTATTTKTTTTTQDIHFTKVVDKSTPTLF
jgi:type VI protein secretion system component Hcp